MKNCKVTNCEEKYYGRNYCRRHHHQWYYCGKILKHTRHDSNEIFDRAEYMEAALYNKNQKIKTFFKFDKKDIELVKKYRWCLNGGYAKANFHNPNGVLSLHRLILNTPEGMDSDHINRDKLDNRRINLRIATKGQNQANKEKISKRNTFKGVYPQGKKWVVKIQHNHIPYHIGTYLTEHQAALAYNLKAQKLYGEFAKLNVIT